MKWSALLMSVVFCGLQFQILEFLKIPFLIHHYNDRRVEEHDLTFMSYIKEQYHGETSRDSSNGDDLKLPFKNPDSVFRTFFRPLQAARFRYQSLSAQVSAFRFMPAACRRISIASNSIRHEREFSFCSVIFPSI
jgi:hypothetical protein